MKKISIIFCIGALFLSFLIAWLTFPMATMSDKEIKALKTAKSPEQFQTYNLDEFGDVSVLEMMEYYLTNPPAIFNDKHTKKGKNHGC